MHKGLPFLGSSSPHTHHSVYFGVNILLEALTFTVGGLLSAVVTYWMIGYQDFTHPHNVWMNFFIYTLLLILHANVAGGVVHMCAVMSPNADIAFAMVGGELFPISFLSEFHWGLWAAVPGVPIISIIVLCL